MQKWLDAHQSKKEGRVPFGDFEKHKRTQQT